VFYFLRWITKQNTVALSLSLCLRPTALTVFLFFALDYEQKTKYCSSLSLLSLCVSAPYRANSILFFALDYEQKTKYCSSLSLLSLCVSAPHRADSILFFALDYEQKTKYCSSLSHSLHSPSLTVPYFIFCFGLRAENKIL
jgi:hypothetical protein